MLDGLLDDLTADHIVSLVGRRVMECRTLEFKSALPGGSEGERKEFLADVTALANTSGGDLVFGIGEDAGCAWSANGVALADADREIARLDAMLRDGVDPRLASIQICWIPLAPGSGFLVLRVPASLGAPHRVKLGGSSRFWARSNAGKYEMDTLELRHAFGASEALPARLRALHVDAVEATGKNELPFVLRQGPTVVATIVPLAITRQSLDLDIVPERAVRPPGQGSLSWHHDLQGVIWHDVPEPGPMVTRYALTHRRGGVDAAWSIGGTRCDEKLVWAQKFEGGLTEVASATSAAFRALSVEGPSIVMCTVRGIRGHSLLLDQHTRSEAAYRETAGLTEVVVEHLDAPALLPAFRAFWRLFGMIRPQPGAT